MKYYEDNMTKKKNKKKFLLGNSITHVEMIEMNKNNKKQKNLRNKLMSKSKPKQKPKQKRN